MCRTYVENLIDFQCSDTWQDDYFEQGLTPFHSPGYERCRDRLDRRVRIIEESIEELATIAHDMSHATSPKDSVYVRPNLPPSRSPSRYTRIP